MADATLPARGEQGYQPLVEAIIDYTISMLDLAGRVTSWNADAQRLKGYADEEIVRAHVSRFYTSVGLYDQQTSNSDH
jgi:hypothetical protein